MARSMWTGSIGFGLVNVPIKMYTATTDQKPRFRQINSATSNRVQQKRVDSVTGKDVPYEAIIKGYEISEDQIVPITAEEIEAVQPEKTKQIALESFCDESEVDPMIYDSSYYLAPQKGAENAYLLLVEALVQTGRAAVGRVVLRTQEKLVVVRAHEGRLLLSTVKFAAEVNEVPEVKGSTPSDAEVGMAVQLIDALTSEFDHTAYQDEYTVAVMEMIEAKSAGETVKAAAPKEKDSPAPDLMAALQASLEATPETPKKKPAAKSRKKVEA